MNKKEKVLNDLTDDQKQDLLTHFNNIYECRQLTDHENNIIYLAWMWAEGIVYHTEDEFPIFDEEIAEVPLMDYEVSIENDMTGGVNLDLMYSFYDLPGIIKIINR